MRNLSENLHATEKRLMEELLTGKNSAIELQTLLQNPVKDEGSTARRELAMKVLRSFTDGISIVSSCTAVSAQISAVDCGGGGGSACSGERKKKVVKDKRGCYKRKRTLDSWTKESPTVEDGCAWRKYGQKRILNSKYPRCYYRCTHKSQGCEARKQVQMIKEDPLYQTTYFHHHTCADTHEMMLPHRIVEPDPIESNLLSFQASNYMHSPKPANISLLKQEFEAVDTQIVGFPCAKSSVNASSWHGIIGSASSGCKQVLSPRILVPGDDLEEEVSGLYSCASMNSFHGLDIEVNQLGDIDFDAMYNEGSVNMVGVMEKHEGSSDSSEALKSPKKVDDSNSKKTVQETKEAISREAELPAKKCADAKQKEKVEGASQATLDKRKLPDKELDKARQPEKEVEKKRTENLASIYLKYRLDIFVKPGNFL